MLLFSKVTRQLNFKLMRIPDVWNSPLKAGLAILHWQCCFFPRWLYNWILSLGGFRMCEILYWRQSLKAGSQQQRNQSVPSGLPHHQLWWTEISVCCDPLVSVADQAFWRCEHLPWNHSLQSLDGRFCDHAAVAIDGIYTETRKSIIPKLLIAVEIAVKIKSPKWEHEKIEAPKS